MAKAILKISPSDRKIPTMVPMPQAITPTIRIFWPVVLNSLLWIAASTMAPTAPMAPASVGVARPSIMVPSTTKISTAEGMMPSRHLRQSGQPVSVRAVFGTGGT